MSVTAAALHYYNSCFYMSMTSVGLHYNSCVYMSVKFVALHYYNICFT